MPTSHESVRAATPHSSLFLQVPFPILTSDRVSRLEGLVWGVVYTWEELGRNRLSQGLISRLLGTYAKSVRRSVEHLVELGMMRRESGRAATGERFVHLSTLWPDWIARTVVPRAVRRRETPVVYSEDDDGCDGDVESRDRPQGVGSPGPQGVGSPGPQGVGSPGPRVKVTSPPGKKSVEGRRADAETRRPPRVRVLRPETMPTEETFEGEPDPDSPTGRRLREERERERTARREARGSRRGSGRGGDSGDEFRETPSTRPEFTRWRGREDRGWTARDALGYWAVRFREVVGEEDVEMRFGSLGEPEAGKLLRNASIVLKKFLGGDGAKWRTVVDRFLAERGASTRSLSMLLTPSNPRAVLDLLDGRRRSAGSTESPWQTEERIVRGMTREDWRRMMRESNERAAARKTRAGGAS